MFTDAALAARIDRVEANLSRTIAEAVPASILHDLAGGVAVFARPGSPINKLIGIGFTGPLDELQLRTIESQWHTRGEPPRVELSSLADPAVAVQLGARGYGLVGFEHVLVRPLTPADAEHTPHHQIHTDHPDWQRVLVDGFAAPDGTGAPVDDYGREAIDAVMTDFARAPGFHRYVATHAAHPTGAATMRLDDRIALLCGATTLPKFRRQGVQAALMRARLRDASRAGCEVAVVTTAPGSLSQHNAIRQGFTLAYARAILVHTGASR